MILVDTSIWIDYLGPKPGTGAKRLDELVEAGIPFALSPVILQEILQGATSAREFDRLEQNLHTQRMLQPKDLFFSCIKASEIYARCRWAGITPRSTIDCLIAQIAIEHRAPLLHTDADYDRIAKIIPELILY